MVERDLAKVDVVSSSLIARSNQSLLNLETATCCVAHAQSNRKRIWGSRTFRATGQLLFCLGSLLHPPKTAGKPAREVFMILRKRPSNPTRNRMHLLQTSNRCLIIPALAAALAACHAPKPTGGGPPLGELGAWMAGTFSSREQSLASKDYFDIRLVMIPIWTERTDGPWLYVEQAVAASADKPYRQRIYHLSYSPGRAEYRSAVYTLPGDPSEYAQAWKNMDLFQKLAPGDLSLRDGCDIVMRRSVEGIYSGSTSGRDCPSERSGAAYATSDVVIERHQLTSWDRGYDSNGRQVWGAVKGPYIFKKLSDRAPG